MILYDLTRVWRVENTDGIGPYRATTKIREDFESSGFHIPLTGNPPERPHPTDDKKLRHFFGNLSRKQQSFWSCGFDNVQQYKAWFDTEDVRGMLAADGFKLNSYVAETCHVKFGDKQILFPKAHATMTASHDCVDVWGKVLQHNIRANRQHS